MSKTPERPGHQGVHADAFRSAEKLGDHLSTGELEARECTPFTHKWICQDRVMLLIVGLMKRSFIECECDSGTSSERVKPRRRGGAVRERDISDSDSSAREEDVQKETEGKRREPSWQPTISFGVKQRACWEPQRCADSTLSTQTKHESVSSHNTLICLSQQIHQLNYKVYWQRVNRCNTSTVMSVHNIKSTAAYFTHGS